MMLKELSAVEYVSLKMSGAQHTIELHTERSPVPTILGGSQDMFTATQVPAPPATAAQAVAMAQAGLGWLATTDAATLTLAGQAECLHGLEKVRSMHTAAHARILRAFSVSGGPEADGLPTARTWLREQTRVTKAPPQGRWGGCGG
jgi:tryptophan synthase beta subunit